MSFANSFRDLKVYKLSRELTIEIFELTKKFPVEERYSLTDQLRCSSRSVGAQIAEAWGKRRYEKRFISKLTMPMENNRKLNTGLRFRLTGNVSLKK
jgi:four helix bundle protein